jgi:hypothetical protein
MHAAKMAKLFDRHRRTSNLSHLSHISQQLPTVVESPMRPASDSNTGQAGEAGQVEVQASVSMWDRLKFWKGPVQQGSAAALPAGQVPQFHPYGVPAAGSHHAAKQSPPAGTCSCHHSPPKLGIMRSWQVGKSLPTFALLPAASPE